MALVNLENKKQIIIIVFAILAGFAASALVGSYISSNVNEQTRKLAFQYEKAQTQKDQQGNEQIALLNQRIIDVEARSKKAVEDAAKTFAEQKAKVVAPIELVRKKPSLALRTPAGKRAITVQVDSLGAVGGLLNPGDFVDVIAHLDMPAVKKMDPKEKVTAMIFQNIQVLAINTNIDEPGAYDVQQKEKSLRVTFAVEPQEAGLLAFAEQNGKLDLALRTKDEKSHTMAPAANWTTLAEYVLENSGAELKVSEEKEVVEAPKKEEIKVETEPVTEAKPYIQIYRGGKEL